MGFDNLNSLETLNLQNNKLQHIPEEIMEPILDTLRVVDIMGKMFFQLINFRAVVGLGTLKNYDRFM